jgi:hypothetical protein
LIDPASAGYPRLLKKPPPWSLEQQRTETTRNNMNCPGIPQRMKKTTPHPKRPSPPRPTRKRGAPRRPPSGLSPLPPRPAKKGASLQKSRQIPGPRHFIWRRQSQICHPTRASTTGVTWDGRSGTTRFGSRPAIRGFLWARRPNCGETRRETYLPTTLSTPAS